MLRRGPEEVQVGLDPSHAIVLPDSAEVRTTLAGLASPASPSGGYDAATVDLLADGGLLVDADLLLPLVHGPADDSASRRAGVSALASRDGDAAGELLSRRAGALVELRSCGAPEAVALTDTVAGLLDAAGLPHRADTRDPRHPARPERADRADRAAPPDAVTGLLVCVGEPAREQLDDWLRAGVTHQVLRLVEGWAVIGPFVTPGETACLRCVDAHHTDADPSWPLLVAQHATAVTRPREDAVPEPVDPLLASLAAAWTARELVSHAEGRTPATASVTIRLDPGLTALETQVWPRHPGCGCGWA